MVRWVESKGEARLFGYTCLCTLLARLQAQSRRARLHAAGGRYLRINQDARGAASGPMCDIRSKFLQTPVSSTQLQVLRLADKNTRRNAEKMPWLIMVLVLSATVRLSAQNTDQQSDQPPPQGEIRTYYIAADEIDWDLCQVPHRLGLCQVPHRPDHGPENSIAC
jgi:hypothetical protein